MEVWPAEVTEPMSHLSGFIPGRPQGLSLWLQVEPFFPGRTALDPALNRNTSRGEMFPINEREKTAP